jgi:trehalose-6-phosphatase
MALRDLKSNLAAGDLASDEAADLTFGKGTAYDRRGQEFSNEPFVKDSIELGGTSRFNAITGGFIRGGVLMHAERLIQDTARIGKFLVSNRGITFIAKQVGLQKSNPKVSEPAFSRSPANHRTYNLGVNTLAQVVGQGTGLHVNRQGLTPIARDGYKDEGKFLENYKKGDNTNRLLFLYDNHISTEPAGKIPAQDKKKSALGEKIAKVGDKLKSSKVGQFIQKNFGNPNKELYSYSGGPGSTYGIGNTNIYKYGNTNIEGLERYEGNIDSVLGAISGEYIPTKDSIVYFTLGNTEDEEKDFEDLAKKDKNFDTTRDQHKQFDSHILNGGSRVKNYLATLGKISEDNYNKTRSDGKSYHREERVNLGNPGGDPTNGNTTVDLLNALDVFRSNQDFQSNSVRDLIRFRIEAVDPFNPSYSDVMVFRAFLDSMNDNFTANYNEFNYNGRAESFYTYNSFNRDVSFDFKIATQTAREMRPLYRKLNFLLSNTAPEYNRESNRIMTPFMRLTIGSYFQQLPGVIKSVGISWDKDYPWEITLDAPEGGTTSDLYVLPHVLNVSVTYQPIHDFLPQKGVRSPFIIPHKDSPIANTPGRKLWNSEDISPSLDNAVAKIN